MPWRKAAAARGGRPPPPRGATRRRDVAESLPMLPAALFALAAAALRVGYASYPPPPAPTPPPVPSRRAGLARDARAAAAVDAAAGRILFAPPTTCRRRRRRRCPPPIDALALLGGPAGPIKRPPPVPAPPPSPPPKPPDLVWKLRAPAPSADGGRGGPQGPAHLSLVGSGGELMRVVLQPPQPVQQTANGQQPLPEGGGLRASTSARRSLLRP